MPFRIIRSDITKVKADAIVNSANPEPIIGGGTDSAVYLAAGAARLLAERRRIGDIAPGEAAVTAAFGLPARFIIHTVGPVWQGGESGEYEALASCYRKSLMLAEQLGCRSIAFPLISTGIYGFPKDRALSIALEEISGFLDRSEMEVTLVVFDRSAFELSSALVEDVRQYIDEKYVREKSGEEYFRRDARLESVRRRRAEDHHLTQRREAESEDEYFREPDGYATGQDTGSLDGLFQDEEPVFLNASAQMAPMPKADSAFAEPAASMAPMPKADSAFAEPSASMAPMPKADGAFGKPDFGSVREEAAYPRKAAKAAQGKGSLNDRLKHLDDTFQEQLIHLIDSKGLEDTDVYKRANLDRKLFSKIRCSVNYQPSKRTAMALAVALELNLDETVDLLGRAGIALSPSSKMDLIVKYCIENKIYNINEVNSLLFYYDQAILG